MTCLLLLAILTGCAARSQDLSGLMFTFPEETNTSAVRLNASSQSFSAVTLCLRFKTDLSRTHSLFSLATPNAANAFQIRKDPASTVIDVYVEDNVARFRGLSYELNMWHSVCSTWERDSGLVQLWLDGKSKVRKFVGGSDITDPIIILGQDQDSLGGNFEIRQSFVGMISDVHMWDYILSPCGIDSFEDDLNFTPGNVLNWRALEFQTTGRVLIEGKLLNCH